MATLVPPDPREVSPPPLEPDPNRSNKPETGKRAPDGTWAEGVSGNPAGRPSGLIALPTKTLRAFCRAFVEDLTYRQNLLERILAGKAPFLETLIWHYAYGKPPDKLVVDDKRAPFAVLLRKQVEILHEERTLAGPPGEVPEEPSATAEPKALPAARVERTRQVRATHPEPPQEDNGGGVIWGD